MATGEIVSALAALERRAERLAWQNQKSVSDSRWLRWWNAQGARAGMLIAATVALAAIHWVVPIVNSSAHNFLQHLNFLPIVVAGLLFGWRGAVLATAAAAVLQLPHLLRTWSAAPHYVGDMVTELPVFGLGGIIAGVLADQQRRQSLNLERTKSELQQVYEELRQNFERLKKAERLYAAGQLSAGLAHEIRTPLASISGAAGILKRGHASVESCRECVEIIDRESHRLNRLLTSFLDFARPRRPRFQTVQLREVLDSVAGLAQHAAGAATIDFEWEYQEPLEEVRCDPEQLKQVLLNLVLNAIQASDGQGRIRIAAAVGEGKASVSIRDQGCGIPESERERIFDPFFTTKENGTGLGLAVSANIMEQHGGTLTAESNPDRGMTFRLEFPSRT